MGHGFGIYLHDCRFLSTMQLAVSGVTLEPRATDDSRGNVALIELGNDVDIGLAGGEVLSRQKLVVELRRTLDGARRTVFDDLWFRNRGSGALRTPVRLAFSSAFEDIFEVRGMFHVRGGRHHPTAWEGDRARLAYEGRDGFVRTTWLQFQPAPSRTRRVTRSASCAQSRMHKPPLFLLSWSAPPIMVGTSEGSARAKPVWRPACSRSRAARVHDGP